MANIKTMLGSLQPILGADIATTSANTPADVINYRQNTMPIWPIIDWAFSPVYSPTQYSGYIYLDLGQITTFNTLFLAHPTGRIVWRNISIIQVANHASDSYTNISSNLTLQAGQYFYSTVEDWVTGGRQVFTFDTPITARYIKIQFQSSGDYLQIEEIGIGNLFELQYNEQIATFSRVPGTINEKNIVMQNGRQIKIITGKATDRINLSFQWSDNGQQVRDLYNIFNDIANTGSPLLWLPPIADTDTASIAARRPEFIVLEQVPEMQQSAITVWNCSFSGRCQP